MVKMVISIIMDMESCALDVTTVLYYRVYSIGRSSTSPDHCSLPLKHSLNGTRHEKTKEWTALQEKNISGLSDADDGKSLNYDYVFCFSGRRGERQAVVRRKEAGVGRGSEGQRLPESPTDRPPHNDSTSS